jgi:hypothetical protein
MHTKTQKRKQVSESARAKQELAKLAPLEHSGDAHFDPTAVRHVSCYHLRSLPPVIIFSTIRISLCPKPSGYIQHCLKEFLFQNPAPAVPSAALCGME